MKLENDYRIYELRDPIDWGPKFWTFLYLLALGLPTSLESQQQTEFVRLIKTFYLFLPCIECRYHYYHLVRDKEIQITTRQEAFDMILELHNNVRKRMNKATRMQEEVISWLYKQKRLNIFGKYSYLIIPILCAIVITVICLRKK